MIGGWITRQRTKHLNPPRRAVGKRRTYKKTNYRKKHKKTLKKRKIRRR